MAPKLDRVHVEESDMTLKILSVHRSDSCAHAAEMIMEIAGMRRAVCESCGRVSIDYIEDHFRKRLAQAELDTKWGALASSKG